MWWDGHIHRRRRRRWPGFESTVLSDIGLFFVESITIYFPYENVQIVDSKMIIYPILPLSRSLVSALTGAPKELEKDSLCLTQQYCTTLPLVLFSNPKIHRHAVTHTGLAGR